MATLNYGLLFVYAEPGPDVTEAEFNDWYDNEHAPARLTVPGFTTAARYKAVDAKPPSWLAIYDMDSPDAVSSDAYQSLRTKASPNEASIVSRLASLNRRIYQHLATKENDSSSINVPAKFILIVSMQPKPENDADFNSWYAEEHLDLLSKVPGFLRARRFKLVSHSELAGKADASSAKSPTQYITVYDWDRDSFAETPEFKTAIETPWSVKVFSEIAEMETKLLVLHKSFSN